LDSQKINSLSPKIITHGRVWVPPLRGARGTTQRVSSAVNPSTSSTRNGCRSCVPAGGRRGRGGDRTELCQDGWELGRSQLCVCVCVCGSVREREIKMRPREVGFVLKGG